MGRDEPGTYHPHRWSPPDYSVDEHGKIDHGYRPAGPNNWGRWGDDDKLGTLNQVTPELIVGAAQLVRRGKVLSLSLPIDAHAPRAPVRPAPVHYFTMTGSDAISGLPHAAIEPGVAFADDYILMALQASTQWDGFGHWSYQDALYNGYWVGSITAAGSSALEISAMKDRFVGRGVLLDIARFLDVPYVAPGTPIGPELLDAVADAQGVVVGEGDTVLLRTGYLGHWYELDSADARARWSTAAPGLSREAIPWLHEKSLAAIASDTIGLEVIPNESPVERPMPIHSAALVDLGLPLGELWWLDDLAADCADDAVYEFFLCAPPLNIPGAIASVINPLAIK